MPEIAQHIPPVPSQQEEIGPYTERTVTDLRRDLHSLKYIDSTLIGALEVDGSVDISGSLAATGDLSVSGTFIGTDISISGALYVDSSVDISGALAVTGDVTVSGAFIGTDISISGALCVDGSSDLSDVWVGGDLSITGAFNPTFCITDAGGFLDEDTLESDATAVLASQQSIKAYVGTQIATNLPVGDNATLLNSLGGALAKAITYTTQTAGFMTAWGTTLGSKVLTLTVNGVVIGLSKGANDNENTFVSCFVKSGGTFLVSGDSAYSISWTPLISGGGAPVAP